MRHASFWLARHAASGLVVVVGIVVIEEALLDESAHLCVQSALSNLPEPVRQGGH